MTDIQETQNYDQISDHVRTQLSWKCETLLKELDEMFRDDPTSLTAGMVSAYTGLLKTYGGLWRVTERPVESGSMIPAALVARMVEEARETAALEARESERARIEAESRLALESASSRLRDRLEEVRTKATNALEGPRS
jgi:hypothetical protein